MTMIVSQDSTALTTPLFDICVCSCSDAGDGCASLNVLVAPPSIFPGERTLCTCARICARWRAARRKCARRPRARMFVADPRTACSAALNITPAPPPIAAHSNPQNVAVPFHRRARDATPRCARPARVAPFDTFLKNAALARSGGPWLARPRPRPSRVAPHPVVCPVSFVHSGLDVLNCRGHCGHVDQKFC